MFRARACEPCNVTVTLPPLDVEFIPDGTVDFRLGCASAQHPRHESASLVNLTLTALAVIVTLAGANYWWLGCL